MSVKLTILCENSVGRPIAACGEHGFACLVTTPKLTCLFDTGSGKTLLSNMACLDVDPHKIDLIVLSHGHSDHAGGLLPLLKEIGPRPVIAHPQIFTERCWRGQHELRDISLPHTLDQLEAAGAEFIFQKHKTTLAPGLIYSGMIPRREETEQGDPSLLSRTPPQQRWQMDDFPDDAALSIETEKGLVILLGCAHSGLINTVEYFRSTLNRSRIHAIVGGTHLGPASEEQFQTTVSYLKQLDFDRLGVSHCTGQIRSAQLYAQFPNKVFFASVGSSLSVS